VVIAPTEARLSLGSVHASVRSPDGSESVMAWTQVSTEQLRSTSPWRTFRWHHGQRHFPGSYWSATTSDHVIYESRLELARLLYADFDLQVQWISAQPFLLTAQVGNELRRHVPDFLLLTDSGPVVVDVKPRHHLGKEKVTFTLAWSKVAIEDRGWEYEVWSEPPEAELANLRLLAGYRRQWFFEPDLLKALTVADLDGARLRDALEVVTAWPRRLVWSHLMHLVWSHVYSVDLSWVLSGDHVLARMP
jgi:hypothetical protein